jgi:hypothetical protein
MRERGLAAIHWVCGQADDKADAVLLDSYLKNNISVTPHCIFPLNRAKHDSRQWKNQYWGK